jgi:nucleotide-binding universal stress UspA family protein
MKRYLLNTVIVPWDFSSHSIEALEAALEMVDSPEVIEVVYVTSYPFSVDPGVMWGPAVEPSIEEDFENTFHLIAEKAGYPRLKFTSIFGDPGTEIADLAKERDAGLIVISSHGRTGMNRLLLGSVAERVVRLAPCPVLVLRANTTSKL